MAHAGLTEEQLVQGLQTALVQRNIREGFGLLDAAFPAGPEVSPADVSSVSLLLCIAQWADLGYRNTKLLEAFAARVQRIDKSQLRLLDYLKLRITEAYQTLAAEHPEQTIEILDLVLRIDDGLLDGYLHFLVNFWKGRAHRKQGEYEQASIHILAGRAAAEQANAPELVAVTKIHESWLAFQNGKRQYAFQLLDEAEAALRPTGHTLSLGNIESARGRFVRRSGEYARALRHFEAALALYETNCPDHPNVARALVNAAYVKRLIALELQPRQGQASGAIHARSLTAAREALELLQRAEEIYALHHHQSGTGSVLVNAAHIHLESGDIDRAATEAQRAYDLGEARRDPILKARAKSVQSAVDLARSEEQLGDQPEIALHASLAVEHAETAIALARQTQNKRLLCEAYIARAMAAASDFTQDWETAKDYAGKAAALLSGDDRDHLFRQLGSLKVRLVGATRVDELLRKWSDGQIGDKTFQQVQEEFAELVIPKVWLRSGKNISSVAKTLSISPKKVRRVLRSANKV